MREKEEEEEEEEEEESVRRQRRQGWAAECSTHRLSGVQKNARAGYWTRRTARRWRGKKRGTPCHLTLPRVWCV